MAGKHLGCQLLLGLCLGVSAQLPPGVSGTYTWCGGPTDLWQNMLVDGGGGSPVRLSWDQAETLSSVTAKAHLAGFFGADVGSVDLEVPLTFVPGIESGHQELSFAFGSSSKRSVRTDRMDPFSFNGTIHLVDDQNRPIACIEGGIEGKRSQSVPKPLSRAAHGRQPDYTSWHSCSQPSSLVKDLQVTSGIGLLSKVEVKGELTAPVQDVVLDFDGVVTLEDLQQMFEVHQSIPIFNSQVWFKAGQVLLSAGPTAIALPADPGIMLDGTLTLRSSAGQELLCLKLSGGLDGGLPYVDGGSNAGGAGGAGSAGSAGSVSTGGIEVDGIGMSVDRGAGAVKRHLRA